MKIGIDIDDTTLITVKSMIKYADLYDTKILGRKGTTVYKNERINKWI